MSVDDLAEAIHLFDYVVQQRDRAAAERILDDDFALVLVLPTPAVIPRARWLEVLPDYVVHSYVVEEQHIDQADGVAAVLTRVRMDAAVRGQDRVGRGRPPR